MIDVQIDKDKCCFGCEFLMADSKGSVVIYKCEVMPGIIAKVDFRRGKFELPERCNVYVSMV